MAWIEIAILGMLVVAFAILMIVDLAVHTLRGAYVGLILAFAVTMVVALALNRAGRFTSSALVTVGTAVAAPWCSLLVDPTVLRGDLVPLTYVVVSVILSAMLLGTRVTVAIAAVQWLLLLLVTVLGPDTPFNWVSLLALVFFVSVICVLGNGVIQRDLRQLHRQASRPAVSEAELREQSIRDPLTDLYNRRYLQEALMLEIERTRRTGLSASVLIIDVDRFKQLNDTFGHAAGDGVLRQLAALLTSHCRAGDVVCRFGGDELVVVLPETPVQVALARAERLAVLVRGLVVVGGGGGHGITVSIGLASFPTHGSTALEVLQAADVGLYRAKADGRDCAREGDAQHRLHLSA